MKKFYVYALVDPRDQSVFYIGKGHGKRAEQHEAQARRGQHPNPKVAERIAAILNAWSAVTVLRLWTDLSESEAYEREHRLITMIGVERLANISPGTLSWEEGQRLRAANLLTQYPDLPERLREEISEMAQGRRITPRTIEPGDFKRVKALWEGTPQLDSLISIHG